MGERASADGERGKVDQAVPRRDEGGHVVQPVGVDAQEGRHRVLDERRVGDDHRHLRAHDPRLAAHQREQHRPGGQADQPLAPDARAGVGLERDADPEEDRQHDGALAERRESQRRRRSCHCDRRYGLGACAHHGHYTPAQVAGPTASGKLQRIELRSRFSFVKTCPGCGEQSPDRAKFCLECGAPLPDAAATDRRERRVISVLFADLVGFTSRSERLDVEDVQGFLSRYHQLLRRELERHGGTVEKFVGDAVMAVFGAPVAHEDDAERAVRSALAIQDAVAEMRDGDPVDLHVRVGVTTGEALVVLGGDPRSGEGMASGDVVNTAARLQSSAPVDGVLVDEPTFRATERAIAYEKHAPVVAKGKAEPVVVWQAHEPRSLLPEQRRPEDLPLVGREAETKQLIAAFERSLRERSSQLVTLVGAPGIGKTRLVQELLAHVEALPELVRWRRGRSLAYVEGIAFWALGEMVKAQAGILESDSADEATAKLDNAVDTAILEGRDRGWVASHLRPLIGLEGPAGAAGDGGRAESFAAWRRFFEALAEDGSTVLVFEDVHWADDALLDFIDLLAEHAGGVPLLIVCTARPELLERRPGWGGGKANAQTMSLAALGDDETARFVGLVLGQALLPAETQSSLLERAEGNPLYAQEYVRMLQDQGLLRKEAGGWRIAAEPDAVPESLQAIIAARLDTLSADERRLIQDSAVVGRTAWLGAACALGDVSRATAEGLLHRLERKQLLRRSRRSTVSGEIEFSFSHAVTQAVAYSQIPRAQRATRHEAAAQWIEKLAGGRDDKAELLAHHYTRALELREQTGSGWTQLARKASTALAEAGRQALAVHAYGPAAQHFAAALRFESIEDGTRHRLLLDHATALYRAQAASEATLEAALEAQIDAEDWEGAARACAVFAAWLKNYAANGPRSQEIQARGRTYAARCGYVAVAWQLAEDHAGSLANMGLISEALAVAREWIRRAEEAGDARARARLLMVQACCLTASGDPVAVDRLRDAAAALADLRDERTSVAYANLGEALSATGNLSAAAEPRAAALDWAERLGHSWLIPILQTFAADAAYHDGSWQTALCLAEPLLAHPDHDTACRALWVHARVMLASGRPEGEVEESARELVDYGVGTGEAAALIEGLALKALVSHAARKYDGAVLAAHELLRHWENAGGLADESATVAELGAFPGLEATIGAAAALLPESSRWKSALMAVADGRYAEAATIFHEIGSAPLAAMAHVRAAEHASELGRAQEAKRHALQALTFYQAVGAQAYATRASAAVQSIAEEPLGA